MITDSATLRTTCSELFARYPQAVNVLNDSGTVRSMVLLLADGGDARFFILNSEGDSEASSFIVRRWRAGDAVDLGDETALIPGWAVDAVTHGMPLPRDGSLYGWVNRGRVTTVIAFYAHYTPEIPEPSWSAMPDADLGTEDWPSFTGEHLVGTWLWEYFRAGRIVDLGPLIARTEGAAFWVDTAEVIGSGCIAIARALSSPDGWTLRPGRYVYHQHHDVAPSLDDLLADSSKTDLAPRFR
jgi:hypothetical protein